MKKAGTDVMIRWLTISRLASEETLTQTTLKRMTLDVDERVAGIC